MRARGRSGEDAVGDRGCQAQRLERTFDDVRRDGSDHYLILFQVAGQSAMSQIDRTAQLAVGDVALIDAARPVTFSSRQGDTQWLSLRLPRSPYSPTLDSSGSAVSAGMKRVPGDCSSILFGMQTTIQHPRRPIPTCNWPPMISSGSAETRKYDLLIDVTI
jgi:hypothetical protein